MRVPDDDPMIDPLPPFPCFECGEPMQGVREDPQDDVMAQASFRCANGHAVELQLVEEYEDEDNPA